MKSLRVPLEGHFSAWKKVGEKVSANCEIEPPDSHRLTNWRNWLELTWFDALGELLHPHLPWWNLDLLPEGWTPKEQETKTNHKYHPNISQFPIPKVTTIVGVGVVITRWWMLLIWHWHSRQTKLHKLYEFAALLIYILLWSVCVFVCHEKDPKPSKTYEDLGSWWIGGGNCQ